MFNKDKYIKKLIRLGWTKEIAEDFYKWLDVRGLIK